MSAHYECPECGKRTGLWEGIEVPGWQAIDDQLRVTMGRYGDREVDWSNAQPTGEVGCAECGWESLRGDLEHVVLGVDGQPLPELHPSQLSIDEAA